MRRFCADARKPLTCENVTNHHSQISSNTSSFALVHGAIFFALKLHGPLRRRALAVARLAVLPAALPLLAWAAIALERHRTGVGSVLLLVGVFAAVAAWSSLRAEREGPAFLAWTGLLAATLGTVFASAWPVLLPSTIDTAFDLTAQSASVSPYTLTVLSWVTAFGLPAVLSYQAWTYWVFRQRLHQSPGQDRHRTTAEGSGLAESELVP